MAVRYRSQIVNTSGATWRIDVHDTQYGGSVVAFDTDRDSIQRSLRGENQERHSPFLAAEIKFVMQIATPQHEDFITDLATSPEGRFSIALFRNGSLHNVGIVLSDIARIEDKYYPYGFSITATDGMGVLKTIPYMDTNGPYEGEERIVNHIANCLKKIPHVPTWWGNATAFLRTTVDYYEENFTSSFDDDPLWQTWLNHRTFYKIDTDGEPTYMDAYTVLKTCLEAFGARIFQEGGVWWVEAVEARATDDAIYTRTYGYTMGTPSAANTRHVIPVGVGNDFDKRSGGYWTFLPALRSAVIEYEAFDRYNLLAGKSFGHTQPQASITLDKVSSNSGNARLRLTAQLSARLRNTNQPNTPSPVAIWFQLQIKIGDKYLKRKATFSNFSVTYGQMEWTTTVEYIDVVTAFYTVPYIPSVWAGYIEELVDVVTPELPTSAAVEFYFHFFILAGQGGTNIPSAYYDLTWTLANTWLEVYNNGSPDLKGNGRVYSKINSIEANTEAYKTTVFIGDGPSANTISRLKRILPTGNEWVDTEKWGLRTGPRTQPLLELVAERILRGQLTARHKMYATFLAKEDSSAFLPFYAKITHRGISYLPLSIEHQIERDEYAGEWFEALYDESSPVTTGIAKEKSATSTPSGSITGGTTTTTSTQGNSNGCACLAPMAATTLAINTSAGMLTSITVSDPLSKNAFLAGEQIAVVNPANAQVTILTVTAPVAAGDTTIQVTGNFAGPTPAGAYVISPQKNSASSAGVLANLNGVTRLSVSVPAGGISVPIEAGTFLITVWILSTNTSKNVRIGTTVNGNEILYETTIAAGLWLAHPANYGFEQSGNLYLYSSTVTTAILYLMRE